MSSSRETFQRRDAALLFRQAVDDLVAVLGRLDDIHLDAVTSLAADIHAAWREGGKLMVCGNGGSAADSQHIVAELVGRFLAERPGYPALALTTNCSTLTAVGNDYGFDHIFARQIQALGGPRDVLLVISTSGNSANCVLAVEEARRLGMKAHGFLGGDGGRLLPLLDGALVAPSGHTPKIQEIHITMGHLLCMILEKQQDDPAG
jgi:D-sedoheptulose 7-phosphate isomerase